MAASKPSENKPVDSKPVESKPTEWIVPLFSCGDDCGFCCKGCCCPCCAVSDNWHLRRDLRKKKGRWSKRDEEQEDPCIGVLLASIVCFGLPLLSAHSAANERRSIAEELDYTSSARDTVSNNSGGYCVHCCCSGCAFAQEHQELKKALEKDYPAPRRQTMEGGKKSGAKAPVKAGAAAKPVQGAAAVGNPTTREAAQSRAEGQPRKPTEAGEASGASAPVASPKKSVDGRAEGDRYVTYQEKNQYVEYNQQRPGSVAASSAPVGSVPLSSSLPSSSSFTPSPTILRAQKEISLSAKELEIIMRLKMDSKDVRMVRPLSGVSGNFSTNWIGKLIIQHAEGSRAEVTRPVIVKQIKRVAMSKDEEMVEFANLAKACGHPNIVNLLGICLNKDQTWILTEIADFGSLDRIFTNEKARGLLMNPKCFTSIVSDLWRGLAHLHANAFVHRDLAARNCLLERSGRVKITDLGLARSVKFSQQGEYLAPDEKMRPALQPPESNRGEISNFRTDVWMMGTTILELMLGRRVRQGDLDGVTEILAEYKGACSAVVVNLVGLALTPDPVQRPTAQQCLDMLGAPSMPPESNPCEPVLTVLSELAFAQDYGEGEKPLKEWTAADVQAWCHKFKDGKYAQEILPCVSGYSGKDLMLDKETLQEILQDKGLRVTIAELVAKALADLQY